MNGVRAESSPPGQGAENSNGSVVRECFSRRFGHRSTSSMTGNSIRSAALLDFTFRRTRDSRLKRFSNSDTTCSMLNEQVYEMQCGAAW